MLDGATVSITFMALYHRDQLWFDCTYVLLYWILRPIVSKEKRKINISWRRKNRRDSESFSAFIWVISNNLSQIVNTFAFTGGLNLDCEIGLQGRVKLGSIQNVRNGFRKCDMKDWVHHSIDKKGEIF